MFWRWLKGYVPRSLYGRAALILLVPVVTIQLVVSVVFIQRLYADVTEQMTRNAAVELRFLLDELALVDDPGPVLASVPSRLGLGVRSAEAAPTEDARIFYDLSGRAVIATLRAELPELRATDLLRDSARVHTWLASAHGIIEVTFPRRLVTARNPHQLLVLMVVTSLLMTVISYLFLRNQLRPVKRLAHAAEAFGRGRVVPYWPSGATEMRAAGSAFLDMRNRIERHLEQRTLMLSGVSHDLRTPLTRMKLALSMADDPALAADLEREVRDMQKMLDAFLDFARGGALGDPETVEAEPFLRDLVAHARAAGRDVTLAPVASGGEVTLRPLAIERALDNLIGNAVRYGTRAEVRLTVTERAAVISVEDDGPGIPPDRREEALRPFARLDAARNLDGGGGVGLGLAIALDIARQHGGTLRLGHSGTLGGLKADLVLAR